MTDDEYPKNRVEARQKGINRYYTGIPCTKGHLSLRGTLSGACQRCRNDKAIERRRQERAAFRAAVHDAELRKEQGLSLLESYEEMSARREKENIKELAQFKKI